MSRGAPAEGTAFPPLEPILSSAIFCLVPLLSAVSQFGITVKVAADTVSKRSMGQTLAFSLEFELSLPAAPPLSPRQSQFSSR
jgi:hypothetical protein